MPTVTASFGEPALVLWDVDRTLVSIAGVGRMLYERAFPRATGRPLGPIADMTGRTERAIIIDTLRLNGIERPEPFFAPLFAALGEAARELAEPIREAGQALPGAKEAVAAFLESGVTQSVVTGNIRAVALAKLGAFGLTDHLDFSVGGYGDDSGDRADLVRLARERAAARYGPAFAGKRTFVIGDTPLDIRGAHDAGAYAVGVATGGTAAADLIVAGAELVLDDLEDLAPLRAAVLGAG
jgi:phosphoglycolate phosphatase